MMIDVAQAVHRTFLGLVAERDFRLAGVTEAVCDLSLLSQEPLGARKAHAHRDFEVLH
jgi:hypothetical protein